MKTRYLAAALLMGALALFALSRELNSPGEVASTGTPCDQRLPLALVSVRQGTVSLVGFGGEPTLVMTWSNCAGHAVRFNTTSSVLRAVLSVYGQTSDSTAYLDTATFISPASTNAVDPRSTITITALLEFQPPLSTSAVVQSISGTLTATDPVTAQAISAPEDFTA